MQVTLAVYKFKYSSTQTPDLHPIDAVRQSFGPVDVQIKPETTPHFAVSSLSFSKITISSNVLSAVKVSRKAKHFNRDEINLIFSERGGGHFQSGNIGESLDDGDIILRDTTADGVVFSTQEAAWKALIIPKATLEPMLNKNAIVDIKRFAPNAPAGRLLNHYLNAIFHDKTLDISGYENLIATHICDLAALLIGADSDTQHQAETRGVMVARRTAAECYIRDNLLDNQLSDQTIARSLGVSPSYIRKLFVTDNGLHAFITKQRLSYARRLLLSPNFAAAKIIDIAFRCGFSSLGTFNRQFKKEFGCAPSEMRDLL